MDIRIIFNSSKEVNPKDVVRVDIGGQTNFYEIISIKESRVRNIANMEKGAWNVEADLKKINSPKGMES